MTEQEQFEAAMSAYCDPAKVEETFYREGDGYESYATLFAWYAWQAARATAEQSEPVAQAPMKDDDIEKGWRATFSTDNPYCPCNLKSFTKAVRWAERALKSQQDAAIESKPAEQSMSDAWISVEDQLPPLETLVLVTGWSWNEPAKGRFQTIAQRCEDGKLREDGSPPETNIYPPTHWQLLPKPPTDAAIESQRSGDGS